MKTNKGMYNMKRISRFTTHATFVLLKACFMRRIFVASNAIQTIDNETAYLIIYCLKCIRRDGNSTYKTGLMAVFHCSRLARACGANMLQLLL